jgi:hypothetical protein
MMPDQKSAEKHSAPNSHRDLISGLYREIGITAVVAALEATAGKSQKPLPSHKDVPAVLRGEMAA